MKVFWTGWGCGIAGQLLLCGTKCDMSLSGKHGCVVWSENLRKDKVDGYYMVAVIMLVPYDLRRFRIRKDAASKCCEH